ncbi:MAG: DUF4332 domain-containing protein [Pirellulaceae bacterium]
MKLNDLAIRRTDSAQRIQINDLHPKLNVVVSKDRQALERIQWVLQYVLFGDKHVNHDQSNVLTSDTESELVVSLGDRKYRLTRPWATREQLTVEGLGDSRKIDNADELFGRIDGYLFGRLFCLDLAHPKNRLAELATVLTRRLNARNSHPRFSNRSEYERWQIEAAQRVSQLESQRTRLVELNRDIDSVANEIATKESWNTQQRTAYEGEIARIENEIVAARRDADSTRTNLIDIDRQIEELRLLINRRANEHELVPVQSIRENPLVALYARLDEVNLQLSYWQAALEDVQARRIVLRDEMEVWRSLDLDAEVHPYHLVRQLLLSLDDDVFALGQKAQDVRRNEQQESNEIRTFLNELPQVIEGARNQLQDVCDELAGQFRTLRNDSAVSEFKFLRHAFTQYNNHLERLSQLRLVIIAEIRQLDSMGADAIERNEVAFAEIAAVEGTLAARRRLLGKEPSSPHVEYRSVAPDLTREQAQLDDLNSRRYTIRSEVARLESAMHSRIQDKENLLARRREQADLEPLRRRLESLRQEKIDLDSSVKTLANLVEIDRTVPPFVENRILNRASIVLDEISGKRGQLLRLTDDGSRIQCSIDSISWNDVEALSFAEQQIVVLAVTQACREAIESGLVDLPVLLKNSDSVDRFVIAQYLNLVQSRNEQTVLLQPNDSVAGDWLNNLSTDQYRVVEIHFDPVVERTLEYLVAPYVEFSGQSINWREQNRVAYEQPRPTPYVYSAPYELRSKPVETPRLSTFTLHRDIPPEEKSITAKTANFRPAPVVELDENTALRNVDLVDSIHLKNLSAAGVMNIGTLLELDPEELPPELLSHGFDPAHLDRWQAQAWLMLCVPGMVPSETRLLIACGIHEPEQLETTNVEQLLGRINRYLSSPDGQRLAHGSTRFSSERINDWYRSLSRTRGRWRQESGYSRPQRRRSRRNMDSRVGDRTSGYFQQSRRSYEPGMRYFDDSTRNTERSPRSHSGHDRDWESRERDQNARSNRDWRDRDRDQDQDRQPREDISDRNRSTERNGIYNRGTREERDSDDRQKQMERREPSTNRHQPTTSEELQQSASTNSGQDAGNLKFYLNLTDNIEAAPSIGPKTAERFTNIGVVSVQDFLKSTAESMAEKINYKRITADIIRTWQDQTRLVCRVPNLRGHDAQLLVACGIIDPDELAGMNPKKLLSLVGPFSDTKEGLKIIRSGKKPDLAEVTDWIDWAKHTRNLQAA